VCLIPTTIGALLSAIGIAGMDRMVRANVIATSGRAVEAAGDVDVLLLDKTGTITLGDRQASAFIPAPGVSEQELADVAQLASLADETPEGRSIMVLAKQKFQLRGRDLAATSHTFHKFTAQTRMSGVDIEGRRLRKGAADAVRKFIEEQGGSWPSKVTEAVDTVARAGSTPLVVADGRRGARRGRAARHRQGRHSRTVRRAAADGHQDDHGHRRQPADGCGESPPKRASMTSSPKPRRKRSSN
jgi:K+-transporting ATPase ATPase B chain